MKRCVVAALMLAASVGSAFASSYDDFALAVTVNIRGDADAAIKGFTAALAAGDLVPAYVVAAYRGRAMAYLEKDRCSDALADLNASAALRPLDRQAYYLRAAAKLCVRDDAGAQQDFEAGNGPVADAERFYGFALQQWQYGFFQSANSNIEKAIALLIADKNRNERVRYTVLWYAITADRLGVLDRAKLAQFVDFLDSSRWPMPLLDLYLGNGKIETVVAKAARGDHDQIAGQKCEADFYLAEWYIARGDTAAAKPLIASAVSECPKGFIETPAAKAEAKRLGLKEDSK